MLIISGFSEASFTVVCLPPEKPFDCPEASWEALKQMQPSMDPCSNNLTMGGSATKIDNSIKSGVGMCGVNILLQILLFVVIWLILGPEINAANFSLS